MNKVFWTQDKNAPVSYKEMAWGWGVIIAIVAVLLGIATYASAQTSSAATRIADAAQPENILVDPIACLEKAEKVFKDAKKAGNYCEKIFSRGGQIVTKVANEAADATKNSRPTSIVAPAYGYGGYPSYGYGVPVYGTYGYGNSLYGSGGYRSNGRVYSQPNRASQLAIPRAPVAQRRTAPPPAQ